MILEEMTEEECYLYALTQDESGIDLAEFCFIDESATDEDGNRGDGCFRAWPFQYPWFRNRAQKHIDAASRSCGKSLSVKLRAFAFPFLYPGEEMVITAPEAIHLQAVTDNIESLYLRNKLANEMLAGQIKHRPYHMNFASGARIMGRIPKLDGTGIQGCVNVNSHILTQEGYKLAKDVKENDLVWSHLNRWTKVLHNEIFTSSGYEIKGAGSFKQIVSEAHRFYGQEALDYHPKKKLKMSPRKWADIDDLQNKRFYWAAPRLRDVVVDYEDVIDDVKLAWILGLYAADGYFTSEKGKNNNRIRWRMCIVAHPDTHEFIFNKIDELGFNHGIQERKHSSADVITISNKELCERAFCIGKGAENKVVPPEILFASEEVRRSFLEGYMFGDGTMDKRGRLDSGSCSKLLTTGVRHLAVSLGYFVSMTQFQPKTTHINGVKLKKKPKLRHTVIVNHKTNSRYDDEFIYGLVKDVNPVVSAQFATIVTEDHSYMADGVISHNTHPLVLEHDEASSYPEAGWTEIKETFKVQNPRSRWRCHGVSFGIGGTFNEYISGKNSTWTVTRLPAMYRPNWSEKERQDKIIEYKGYDSPGYRRNILGLPADAGSPIFVVHRLMACTDSDKESVYNTSEYYLQEISESEVRESGNDIESLLRIPATHSKYKRTWIGMDLGWTQSPSSIVIFAEEKNPKKSETSLRLITRILLNQITPTDQVKVIMHLMDLYRPLAYALDGTGAGFPLIDNLRSLVRQDPELGYMLDRIKDCNFSEKVIVGFDDKIPINEHDPNGYMEAAIKRTFVEASTDAMRVLIDDGKMILPYDRKLLDELQAVEASSKQIGNTLDAYGRSGRKKGMHNLDAMRMAVFTYHTHFIDEMIAKHKQIWQPPPMLFG